MPEPKLPERTVAILALADTGLRNVEIAERLDLDPKKVSELVRKHRPERLTSKRGLPNVKQRRR